MEMQQRSEPPETINPSRQSSHVFQRIREGFVSVRNDWREGGGSLKRIALSVPAGVLFAGAPPLICGVIGESFYALSTNNQFIDPTQPAFPIALGAATGGVIAGPLIEIGHSWYRGRRQR